MAGVELRNLVKHYPGNDEPTVRGINLSVADREFVVLVGPSGCGKSTVLRMIAGLEDVTSGEIHIGDRRVDAMPPKARNIAMVFQNYALFPNLDVAGNVAFGLKVRGIAKEARDEAVRGAAETVGLSDLLHRKPGELSGGQRQRVAIARAIVRQPDVFLFDEPLSNLDARLRGEMRTELIRLARRLETTMIYVTHDQVEAMTMADRIVVFDGGEIQQAGRPSEVYERPANRFVAGFLGAPPMNFLEGRCEDGAFVIGDARLELGDTTRSDGPAVLGVRPEDLHVDGAVPSEVDGTGPLEATVEVVEYLGSESSVSLASPAGQLTLLVRERPPAVGSVVRLMADRGRLHVFDAS